MYGRNSVHRCFIQGPYIPSHATHLVVLDRVQRREYLLEAVLTNRLNLQSNFLGVCVNSPDLVRLNE